MNDGQKWRPTWSLGHSQLPFQVRTLVVRKIIIISKNSSPTEGVQGHYSHNNNTVVRAIHVAQ